MNKPRNFFAQELDRFSLLLFGNLVGAVGVIFLVFTVRIAMINLRNFFLAGFEERLVSGFFLLASALLTYWLLFMAYRMVTEKGGGGKQ